MTRDKSHSRAGRRPSTAGMRCSEAMVFGLSRGLYLPPDAPFPAIRTKPMEAGASFEETYPSYPFSELVRLGIALAQWLAGARGGYAVRRLKGPEVAGGAVEESIAASILRPQR